MEPWAAGTDTAEGNHAGQTTYDIRLRTKYDMDFGAAPHRCRGPLRLSRADSSLRTRMLLGMHLGPDHAASPDSSWASPQLPRTQGLLSRREVPDLSAFRDVSEFVTKSGYGSVRRGRAAGPGPGLGPELAGGRSQA